MFKALMAWKQFCKVQGIKDLNIERACALTKRMNGENVDVPTLDSVRQYESRKERYLAGWIFANEGWDALDKCKDEKVRWWGSMLNPCESGDHQCSIYCAKFENCAWRRGEV